MAYVQGSLGEKISKTMDDAAALFKQGDYQQSIDMFARAWDLLPDSKYSYDESYLIVWRILIVALKANDTAVMRRWVKHIFLADPERADCGEREMWGARVAMACGDKVLKEAILPLEKHTGTPEDDPMDEADLSLMLFPFPCTN